jgi:hypothetical protein
MRMEHRVKLWRALFEPEAVELVDVRFWHKADVTG